MKLTSESKKILVEQQPLLLKASPTPDRKEPSTMMQPLSNFKCPQDFTLLLMAPPGAGKTTCALQLVPHDKQVLLIDCDKNLRPATAFLSKHNPELLKRAFFHQVEPSPTLPDYKLFDEVFRLAKEASTNPEIGTIIVDSATLLCDWCIKKVLREQPTKTNGMEKQSWGPFYNAMFNFVTSIKNMNKWFVLVCHEVYDQDELSGILKYKPNIPGKSASILPGLFSDYWRLDISTEQSKRVVRVRTMPDPRCTLRCSIELPDKQVFDPKLIVDKLLNFSL